MRAPCSRRRCAPAATPRTPTSSTGRPAPASARSHRRSRRRCLADEAHDAASVRERIAHGSHPDMTWVTRSGASEMLVADIEQPVVAAATRTPFEAARRVFVIEAVETMNEQAANRMLKTLEEPPDFVHLLLLTNRREDVLATIVSRCQLVRFDPLAPEQIAAGLDGVSPERAEACARLALGDAQLAAQLAERAGRGAARERRALRARGVRRRERHASVGGDARRGEGRRRRRRRARGAVARGRARAGAGEGAQKTRARTARGAPPARAPRAHRCAGADAAPGRAVAARRAVHRRGRGRADLRGRSSSPSSKRTRTGAARRSCARASSWCRTRACAWR